jgi:hypothetical protein
MWCILPQVSSVCVWQRRLGNLHVVVWSVIESACCEQSWAPGMLNNTCSAPGQVRSLYQVLDSLAPAKSLVQLVQQRHTYLNCTLQVQVQAG